MRGWHKFCSSLILCALGLAGLWAGGNKELEGENAEGLSNWDYTLDIKDKKPGKYNVIIEAKDKAGNVELAGPYNIWVDPESDVPVVQINNPYSHMRVSGNLNILGTALDDDGIERVEISLDGQEAVKAQGREYWSYYVPVADIPDGPHRLAVVAYDINGLASKTAFVDFDLDKYKPDTSVLSPASGTIVSQQCSLKGISQDANGIKLLEISEDGGKTFKNLPIRKAKGDLSAEFEYRFDSRKYPDGPHVIWLRSTDKTKSISVSAFLLFIDNASPDITVLYPSLQETVHGKFRLFASIKDALGIKSLSYTFDGLEKELSMVPGNPYFSLALDLSGKKDGRYPILIKGLDIAGNLREYRQDLILNNEADLPKVELFEPREKNTYSKALEVRALLKDDDGIQALYYQVDGQKPEKLASREAAFFTLDALTSGAHTLELWAEDIYGVQGPKTKRSFVYLDQAPQISLLALESFGKNEAFSEGMSVYKRGNPLITGLVSAPNGLSSLEYAMGSLKNLPLNFQKTAKSNEYSFQIKPSENLPYGLVDLDIHARDALGEETVFKSFVYVKNDSRISGDPYAYFKDARLKEGTLAFSDSRPAYAFFAAQTLASVRMDPPLDFIKLVQNEAQLALEPLKAGNGETSLVFLDSKGHELRYGPFRILSDLEKPKLLFTNLNDGDILKEAKPIQIQASDDLGLERVEWTLGTVSGTLTPQGKTGPESSLDLGPLWANLSEGPQVLRLKAVDQLGKEQVVSRVFLKDSTALEARIEAPAFAYGDYLPIYIDFAKDSPAKLAWRLDEGAWQDLEPAQSLLIPLDKSQLAAAYFELKALDAAGNETVQRYKLSSELKEPEVYTNLGPDGKKLPPPKLNASIFAPQTSYWARETLVFQIDASSAFTHVEASLDGKPWDLILDDTSNMRGLSFDTRDFKKSEISLQIIAYTAEKQKQSFNFKLSLDKQNESPELFIFDAQEKQAFAQAHLIGTNRNSNTDETQLHYQIDKDKEEVLPLRAGVFDLNLETLVPGLHTLKLFLQDTRGNKSANLVYALEIQGDKPVLSVQAYRVKSDKEAHLFAYGQTLLSGQNTQLVFAGSSVHGIKSLSLALDDGTFAPLSLSSAKDGLSRAEYSLPDSLDYGSHTLKLKALDSLGQEAFYETAFNFLAPPYSLPILDEEGLYFHSSLLEDAKLHLAPGKNLSGRFVGRELARAWLVPGSDGLKLEQEASRFTLQSLKPQAPSKQTLFVEDSSGDVYSFPEFEIFTDAEGPQILGTEKFFGQYYKDSVDLELSISDPFGMSTVSYALKTSLDDQVLDWQPLAAKASGVYGQKIDLASYDDGRLEILVRALDTSANEAIVHIPLLKDTRGSQMRLVSPPEEDSLNGINTLAGLIQDDYRLEKLSWSADGSTFTPLETENYFDFLLDVQKYPEAKWLLRAQDASGNVSDFNLNLSVDAEKDLPKVEFQTPVEGEVQTKDFYISGMAFDDDGLDSLYYRIDYPEALQALKANPRNFGNTKAAPEAENTENKAVLQSYSPKDPESFIKLEASTSFSIPIEYLMRGDNEHILEMYARDINGVTSPLASYVFRISTAEPVNLVESPSPEDTLKEKIRFSGKASDNNGIESVRLSFDNGNSWHKAQGTEAWSYDLDTRTLADGVYNVQIQTLDRYEISGMYTTLISIDNSAAQLSLDEPLDGQAFKGNLLLSGRVDDAIGVKSLKVLMLAAGEGQKLEGPKLEQTLPNDTVILQNLDLSALSPGWYTLRLEARDKADNRSYISRDIQILEQKAAAHIDVFYPRQGEEASPYFDLSGKIESEVLPEALEVYVDERFLGSSPVNSRGYYSFPLGPELLAAGDHSLVLRQRDAESKLILESQTRSFSYTGEGPWIRLNNYKYGDFVSQRPFLKGESAFAEIPEASEPGAQEKQVLPSLQKLEISFDNGRSFEEIRSSENWTYRLETQNFPSGPLFVLLRAQYDQELTAVYHTMLMVDEKNPEVSVLFPAEEGRFNEIVPVMGTAKDNFDLDSIQVTLRQGDKAAYQVPSFIQGMFLDAHALGATTWEAGLGLTFFDDNVKLQAKVGQAPSGTRFDGYIAGVKLIANIAQIPFEYFFGPDWDFFSMSFGVGADFSYFTMSGDELNFDNEGVILGAAVIQWEFAKFFIKDWSSLRSYSFYAEGQFWFISSDIDPVIEFKTSFGMRIGLF